MSVKKFVTRVYFTQESKDYQSRHEELEARYGEFTIAQDVLGTKYVTHAHTEGYSPLNYCLHHLSKIPEFNLSGRTFFLQPISGDRVYAFALNDGALESSGIYDVDVNLSDIMVVDDLNPAKFVTFIGGVPDEFKGQPLWDVLNENSETVLYAPHIDIATNDEFFFSESVKQGLDGKLILLIVLSLALIVSLFFYKAHLEAVEAELMEEQVDPWMDYRKFTASVQPPATVFKNSLNAVLTMTHTDGWDWNQIESDGRMISISLLNLGGHIDDLMSFREDYTSVTTNLSGGGFWLTATNQDSGAVFPNKIVISGSEINYFIYMCLTTDMAFGVKHLGDEQRNNFVIQSYQAELANATVDEIATLSSCLIEVPVQISSLLLINAGAGIDVRINYSTFSSVL